MKRFGFLVLLAVLLVSGLGMMFYPGKAKAAENSVAFEGNLRQGWTVQIQPEWCGFRVVMSGPDPMGRVIVNGGIRFEERVPRDWNQSFLFLEGDPDPSQVVVVIFRQNGQELARSEASVPNACAPRPEPPNPPGGGETPAPAPVVPDRTLINCVNEMFFTVGTVPIGEPFEYEGVSWLVTIENGTYVCVPFVEEQRSAPPIIDYCHNWIASDFLSFTIQGDDAVVEQDINLYRDEGGILVPYGNRTLELNGDASNPTYSPPRICLGAHQHQVDEDEPYVRITDATFDTLQFEIHLDGGLGYPTWSPEGNLFAVRLNDNAILSFSEESSWTQWTETGAYGTMPQALSNSMFLFTNQVGLINIWVNGNTYQIVDQTDRPVIGDRGEWRPDGEFVFFRSPFGLMKISLKSDEVSEVNNRWATAAFNPESLDEAIFVQTDELQHVLSVANGRTSEVFSQDIGFEADWMGDALPVNEESIEAMLIANTQPLTPPAQAVETTPPAGEEVQYPEGECHIVNTGSDLGLKVHSIPGLNTPVVGSLANGTEVFVLAQDGNWSQIAEPDGFGGWQQYWVASWLLSPCQ